MSDEIADRKAQTRAIFDHIAADYDGGGPGCFAHFGERLVEITGVERGQKVLDVATGRRAALLPAAERAGVDGHVVGIDLSGEMVRIAQDEAAGRGLAVQVQVMDAEQLDFPDVSFDRVLCGFGVMFFLRLDRALGEFRRVLKPGGRVALSTWRISQGDDLGAVLAELELADVSADPALRFRAPESLERPLVAAGFTDIEIVVDTATFRYADMEEYWQNARGTGMRRWIDALNSEQTERAQTALAERFESFRRPDGFHVEASALVAVAGR